MCRFKDAIDAATRLRDRIVDIKRRSDAALAVVEKADMMKAVTDAANIGLETPTLFKLRELLGTVPDQFLKIQLDVALDQNDTDRAIRVMIEIKGLFFRIARMDGQDCAVEAAQNAR